MNKYLTNVFVYSLFTSLFLCFGAAHADEDFRCTFKNVNLKNIADYIRDAKGNPMDIKEIFPNITGGNSFEVHVNFYSLNDVVNVNIDPEQVDRPKFTTNPSDDQYGHLTNVEGYTKDKIKYTLSYVSTHDKCSVPLVEEWRLSLLYIGAATGPRGVVNFMNGECFFTKSNIKLPVDKLECEGKKK